MAFKLKGIEDLSKSIENKANISDKLKEKALLSGAEIIREAIANKAPRSSINKEHMADHITISEIKNDKVEIGPEENYFYAHFVEFGTSKMAAQPFAFPAFQESKDKALKEIARIISKEIEG